VSRGLDWLFPAIHLMRKMEKETLKDTMLFDLLYCRVVVAYCARLRIMCVVNMVE
jgi:hypothetical protein